MLKNWCQALSRMWHQNSQHHLWWNWHYFFHFVQCHSNRFRKLFTFCVLGSVPLCAPGVFPSESGTGQRAKSTPAPSGNVSQEEVGSWQEYLGGDGVEAGVVHTWACLLRNDGWPRQVHTSASPSDPCHSCARVWWWRWRRLLYFCSHPSASASLFQWGSSSKCFQEPLCPGGGPGADVQSATNVVIRHVQPGTCLQPTTCKLLVRFGAFLLSEFGCVLLLDRFNGRTCSRAATFTCRLFSPFANLCQHLLLATLWLTVKLRSFPVQQCANAHAACEPRPKSAFAWIHVRHGDNKTRYKIAKSC